MSSTQPTEMCQCSWVRRGVPRRCVATCHLVSSGLPRRVLHTTTPATLGPGRSASSPCRPNVGMHTILVCGYCQPLGCWHCAIVFVQLAKVEVSSSHHVLHIKHFRVCVCVATLYVGTRGAPHRIALFGRVVNMISVRVHVCRTPMVHAVIC